MTSATMAYKEGDGRRFVLCRIDRLLFLRWYHSPLAADLADMIEWLRQQRREAAGELMQVEVVGATVARPTLDETRKAMQLGSRMPYFRHLQAIVIDGDGYERALIRGIFSVFGFLNGESFATAPTAEDAVVSVCRYIGQDPDDALRLLREAQVLNAT